MNGPTPSYRTKKKRNLPKKKITKKKNDPFLPLPQRGIPLPLTLTRTLTPYSYPLLLLLLLLLLVPQTGKRSRPLPKKKIRGKNGERVKGVDPYQKKRTGVKTVKG